MDSQETRSVDTFITELLDINKQLEARLAQLEANEGTVFSLPVAIIEDQKAANTPGGTATAGSWFTRVLNTIVTDIYSIVSLSSNQVTLQEGIYWIKGSAPAYFVDRHKTRLRDITNGVTLAVGSSEFTTSAQSISLVSDIVVLTGATVIELQQRVAGTSATRGLGVESGAWGEVEVYARLEITKLA